MHYFTVRTNGKLEHAGDFMSPEYAGAFFRDLCEDPKNDDIIILITIDDLRRLIEQALSNPVFTKTCYFGLRPADKQLVYLGDYPDLEVADAILTDSSTAEILAEVQKNVPAEQYKSMIQDVAWIWGAEEINNWIPVINAVVNRMLYHPKIL